MDEQQYKLVVAQMKATLVEFLKTKGGQAAIPGRGICFTFTDRDLEEAADTIVEKLSTALTHEHTQKWAKQLIP